MINRQLIIQVSIKCLNTRNVVIARSEACETDRIDAVDPPINKGRKRGDVCLNHAIHANHAGAANVYCLMHDYVHAEVGMIFNVHRAAECDTSGGFHIRRKNAVVIDLGPSHEIAASAYAGGCGSHRFINGYEFSYDAIALNDDRSI